MREVTTAATAWPILGGGRGRRTGVRVDRTRSRHAATGTWAPWWSPATTGQRTRAAWSGRPRPQSAARAHHPGV